MSCRATSIPFKRPCTSPNIIIPIDRFHLYNMCAITGRPQRNRENLRGSIYFKIFSITHDRLFIGQDHRVLRYSTFGPEHLSPLDQDVIYWRKFAVRNARGHMKNQKTSGNEMKLSRRERGIQYTA